MKRFGRRGLSLFLALVLTLGLLPTSALAGLVDNSRSQNERILEQLEALWGDEATAEEALALLKQYGLVDEDGNVITDWSDELYLEEDPRPLTLAEAAAARSGAVTVNGHAAQAREVAEALSQLEELGLFDGAALTADWQLAVDGVSTAPADYAAALAQAQEDPAQEETPTEEEEPAEEEKAPAEEENPAQAETPAEEAETPAAEDEPAEEEGGVLATLARALGLDGGEEPAGPAVTVLGTQVSDPDALEDLIDQLDQWGVLTETGALTDWDLTAPGERRQVTAEELTAMAEAGEADDDTLVLVGETPISLGDLRLLLDIEAELRRIQETYFPEGGVDLSVEEAEALYSLYSQLLANGGFTLYNTKAADDLTAADFLSGIDQTVTITASGADIAQMNSAYTVTVALEKAQSVPVTFSWRTFSGSVTAGGSGTVTIPAGETEATFTASVGGAADRLSDKGQGAFVVQIYDVENALFADGADRKDSWTKAVRVHGQDALKYYEEQSATASKTDRNGIVSAADMSYGYQERWARGDATTGTILTGTSNPSDNDAFQNWGSNGMENTLHAVLEHNFTVEGLSTGTYTITFKHDATTATVPKDARDFFSEIGMSIAAIQQNSSNGVPHCLDQSNRL